MENVNQFLKKLKDLPKKSKEEILGDQNSVVQLETIILGYDSDSITFGHYDQVFTTKISEVISLNDPEHGLANAFGYGYPAILKIKSSATVVQLKEYKASDLIANQPFVISRPSITFPVTETGANTKHADWMKERGIFPEDATKAIAPTYTAQTSPQYTTTYTETQNGLDRHVDRYEVDSYPNDRYTVDD